MTIFKKSYFSASGFHFPNRDCLFPGGEEGAGGVLVAEEAFYQVSFLFSWSDDLQIPYTGKLEVGDNLQPLNGGYWSWRSKCSWWS